MGATLVNHLDQSPGIRVGQRLRGRRRLPEREQSAEDTASHAGRRGEQLVRLRDEQLRTKEAERHEPSLWGEPTRRRRGGEGHEGDERVEQGGGIPSWR